ncbi:MAG: acylphosphatase [Thermodesulfovibrionia bacterium]|nr:acylphosphatase [Thermodesulfovibrionia bacterium]
MKKSAVRVHIKGLVQGVFFRAATKETADKLGLEGWVRNLPDGSVEAIFEGEHDSVKKAVQWCHDGPPGARVSDVDEKWTEYAGEFDEFKIWYGY